MGENQSLPTPDRGSVLSAGPFRLDGADARLTRNGVVVALGGKPLELLETLMRAAPRLVTKEEIFEAVWQGRAVSEAVLTTAMRQIRHALGDDARAPSAIETVHGKGYRFLLPVIAETRAGALDLPPPAPDLTPRTGAFRWAAAAALAVALLAGVLWATLKARPDDVFEKSIAILPLVDLSENMDAVWFADGLTDEIILSVSRAPDLRVVSRKAVDALAGGNATPADYRTRLKVANVLEGSVRRAEGRVRVTAQLVRTADGFQLWAQSYDRPEADVIAIQEEIAFEIARALDTMLDPPKLKAMMRAGTSSPAAYDAYLQGAAFAKKSLLEGGDQFARDSADAYERARAIDPGFADAHWQAALNWFANETRMGSELFGSTHSREERLAKYNERLDAAIANAKSDVDALKYRSNRAAMRVQLKDARDLMRQYLEARPRDLDAWEQFATLAAYAGDRRSVARAGERIHSLSMENGWPWSRAVTISVMAMKPDLAARRARAQLKITPDNATLNYQAQRAFLWTGAIDEARKALEYVRTSSLEEENKLLAEIRQACAEGRTNDALAQRGKLEAIGELATRWHAAQLFGEYDKAVALLMPFDTVEGLPTLLQFMFQPTFDAASFPNFSARLATEGVTPFPAIPMPAACHPPKSTS